MRIQIVDGEGNLLHAPALNKDLEADLRVLFARETRFWQWLKRLHDRRALGRIEAAIWQLRLDTRHA